MKYLMLFAVSWLFLPSTYSDSQPVVPHVEELPNPVYQIRAQRRYQDRGYRRNAIFSSGRPGSQPYGDSLYHGRRRF